MCVQGLPALQQLEIVVAADEKLEMAGSVLSVLEGVVVVQGLANSPALAEGWVHSVRAG